MELIIRCCQDCPACYIDSYDDSEHMCALIPPRRIDARSYESYVLKNVLERTVNDSCPLINDSIKLVLDNTVCVCGEESDVGVPLPHKTWCPKA